MERVSGSHLSRLTGKHWGTIRRKLIAAGVVPLERLGSKDIYDSTKALAAVYADPAGDSLDLQQERAKLARQQADVTALKAAQMRGELAPVSLLEQALGRAAAQAAALLEAVPGQLKRRMPHLGQAELDLIRRQLVLAQNAIAEARLDLDPPTEGEADADPPEPAGRAARRKPRARPAAAA